MNARKYKDIVIRGVCYPTAKAAADALGVGEDAITGAARRGKLQQVGSGKRGPEPMRVRVRGVVYEDQKAAATALGVRPSAIRNGLAYDRLDRVGLPRGNNGGGTPAEPFEIGGLCFPSRAVASRELGFGRGYVSRVMRTGSATGRERLMAAAMRLAASPEGARWKAKNNQAERGLG